MALTGDCMKDTDLAYAAGIMDGEGGISISSHARESTYPTYRLRVRVTNTDEWLIHWLQQNFGGSVGVQTQPEGKNWKPAWYWTIGCNPARQFLELILPYLRLKKPQAEIAIRFQSTRKGRIGRRFTVEEQAVTEAEYLLMKPLNKRGL